MTDSRVAPRDGTPGARFRVVLLLTALLAAPAVPAQEIMDLDASQPYSTAEIDELVGPVALYVDDLVAIVLAASAYPVQVVEAARFLDARESDPALQPDAAWDDAIVALLNYPDVLRMMSDRLQWTADLGEAFVQQPAEVLDAIQRFRLQARALGSLDSDEYRTVSESGGAIAILPADPQVVYVPSYEPAEVLAYGGAAALSYYPRSYPLYDYPYPAGYSFGTDFWGVTSAYVLGWNDRRLRVYGYDCAYHPYYRHRYYDPYYARRSTGCWLDRHVDAYQWRPDRHRRTPPPGHRFHDRGDGDHDRIRPTGDPVMVSGRDPLGTSAAAAAPTATSPRAPVPTRFSRAIRDTRDAEPARIATAGTATGTETVRAERTAPPRVRERRAESRPAQGPETPTAKRSPREAYALRRPSGDATRRDPPPPRETTRSRAGGRDDLR